MRRSLAIILILLGVLAPARRAMAAPTESQVMAEFIERFTRFVDWPPASLGDDDDPFVICVVGTSPVRSYLQDIAQDRKVKGRRVALRVIDGSKGTKGLIGCHLAFIGGGEAKRLRLILGQTEGRPVLTVADSPGFAEAGVVINFYREGRFLRFEVNTDAAQDSGLKVRAKLLRLARRVARSP
jgi:hypothetical protein